MRERGKRKSLEEEKEEQENKSGRVLMRPS